MILNGFQKKSFFRIGMWNSRPPPPLQGKKHLKFPFWLCEYLPNLVMSLIRLHSTLCWLIPDWFRRKAHYFTQCLLLMSQGSLFNFILTLYKIQVMEDLGNKKMAHHMITSFHFCVVDIPCSLFSWFLQSNDGLKRKDFYRQRWSSLQVFHF